MRRKSMSSIFIVSKRTVGSTRLRSEKSGSFLHPAGTRARASSTARMGTPSGLTYVVEASGSRSIDSEATDACPQPTGYSPRMQQSPEQVRQRAVDLAAETMGELMAFWGFKASMGR